MRPVSPPWAMGGQAQRDRAGRSPADADVALCVLRLETASEVGELAGVDRGSGHDYCWWLQNPMAAGSANSAAGTGVAMVPPGLVVVGGRRGFSYWPLLPAARPRVLLRSRAIVTRAPGPPPRRGSLAPIRTVMPSAASCSAAPRPSLVRPGNQRDLLVRGLLAHDQLLAMGEGVFYQNLSSEPETRQPRPSVRCGQKIAGRSFGGEPTISGPVLGQRVAELVSGLPQVAPSPNFFPAHLTDSGAVSSRVARTGSRSGR